MHAVCESLYTEDEVEQASDEGFACTSCSPYVPKPVGKLSTISCFNFFQISQKVLGFTDLYTFLTLFIVVESAIMASIKLKEPGE